MMINCPKCNFLQPKDQYCAQCGVNMETYQPPKKPLLKKLLGNWMVQLGLLFVVILGVVMWDNLSSRSRPQEETSLPPVSNQIGRNEDQLSNEQNPPPEPNTESFATSPAVSQNPSPTQNSPSPKTPTTFTSLEKKITLKLITIAMPAIESLVKDGRRVEEGVFVVKSSAGFLTNNRKQIRGYGSAVRKEFVTGKPTDLFYGEVDQETGANLGFFATAKIAEGSTPEAINVEVRVWHQLKLSEETGSAPILLEATLQAKDELFIIDPSVHDVQFTPEEISLFESSRKLNMLNDEVFVDNLSEVALIIEIQ